jgi:hypothetical protein
MPSVAKSRVSAALLSAALFLGAITTQLVVAPSGGSSRAAVQASDPVELTNLTTPTQHVFRNSDGTMIANITAEPVRVRRGSSWVPVDTTLQRMPDGSVSPVASVLPLVLSGGGSAPMVRLGSPGRAYTMTWPAALPSPTLDGDTATYSEVYPGVDLVLRAVSTGFEQSLVVKSAAAAALPQVRSVKLSTVTDGLKAQARTGGGFDVVDGRGDIAFTSAAAAMWDSPDSNPAVVAAPTGSLDASTAIDPVATASDPPPTDGPVDGSTLLPVSESVAASSITLTPSVAALSDPTTTFPVVIDPTVSAPQYRKAMVNKTYPTTAYYNWTGTSSDNYSEGSGYNDTSGVNTKRLYFEFNQSAAAGSNIISATFTPFERFAYSCTASQVDVYNTGGVSSSTTWNNQPDLRVKQDSQTVAYGRTGCSPAGHGVAFNVKQGVSAVEAAGGTMVAFMVRATSETSDSGWKRFSSGSEAGTAPVLSITYDHPPVATSPHMSNPNYGPPCVTGSGRPTLNVTASTNLIVHATDADGGNLTATFGFHNYTDGITNGSALFTLTTAAKAQGQDFSVVFGTHALVDGQIYAWRAYATETTSPNANSAVSTWCEFKQDSSAPPSASVTSSAYPPDDGSGTWWGGANVAGDFLFTPSDAVDTKKYAWSWNGAGFPTPMTSTNSANAAADGTLQITATGTPQIAPPGSGRQILTVWAVDAAGNHQLTGTDYPILVKPSSTIAWWKMNDTPGSLSAADSSGQNACHDSANASISCTLGITGDAVLTADAGALGTGDGGLVLNGNTSAPSPGLVTSDPGVISSSADLTVEAWVQMPVAADLSTTQSAVSLDGITGSGFTLGWDATLNRFAFSMQETDPTTGAPVLDQAVDGLATEPAPGTWVFLAGVFNKSSNQIGLYVAKASDDVLVTPTSWVTHTSTWAATGPVHLGDDQAGGGRADNWAGSVDAARLVPGVRSPTQLQQDVWAAS